MNIVHLIDPGAPDCGACVLPFVARIAREADVRSRVLLIGRASDRRLAQQCGVRVDETLMAPIGHPMLWTRAIRRSLREYEGSAPVDLVHVWSRRAALAVALARVEKPLVASVGPPPPTTPIESWMWKRALKTKHITVVVFGAHARSAFANLCNPVEIPLGIDPNYIDEVDRPLRRERWGVDETAFVVALLGEPLAGVDLITAVGGISRAALAGRDVRLLVHEHAADRIEMTRWLEPLGMRNLVIVENDVAQPWRVCGAVDAALCLSKADVGSSGPMLWAWAGGVAVISSFNQDFPISRGGESSLLAEVKSANDVAQRLLQLHDDQTLRLQVGQAGRAMTQVRHNMEACSGRMFDLYRGLIGRRPPSGATGAPTGDSSGLDSTEPVAMSVDEAAR